MTKLISPEPVQFLSYDDDHNTWKVTDQARRILSGLTKPLKVLSVAGKYRSGKSYLLNVILGIKEGGFDLGHTTKGCTRGVWMWGKDEGDEILLALDTEGLFDTDNSRDFDTKLFGIVLLLSSYTVLNLQSVLDEATLENLSFVTGFFEMIFTKRTTEEEDSGEEYKSIFPPLMFLLRDFLLSLPDGMDLDGYLSKALKETPGNNKSTKLKNEIRRVITQSFPVREIRTIPPPHSDEAIVQNIQANVADLNPKFNSAVGDVSKHITKQLKPKQFNLEGEYKKINDGNGYLAVVETLVQGLNSKGKIDMPGLFDALCESESSQHLQAGLDELKDGLDTLKGKLPMNETLLVNAMLSLRNEILKKIHDKVQGGNRARVVDEFENTSNTLEENVQAANETASSQQCKRIKSELLKKIEAEKFTDIPSFEKRKEALVRQLQEQGIGPAVTDVTAEFDNECTHVRDRLYNELKLQKFEIEAAENARRQKETEMQISQLKKDAEEKDKQHQLRVEALNKQGEALAAKLEEDVKRWHEEREQMKKRFDEEIAQAKRANDTTLMDMLIQQRDNCSSPKKSSRGKKKGEKTVYVNGYYRKNGTWVEPYWRS